MGEEIAGCESDEEGLSNLNAQVWDAEMSGLVGWKVNENGELVLEMLVQNEVAVCNVHKNTWRQRLVEKIVASWVMYWFCVWTRTNAWVLYVNVLSTAGNVSSDYHLIVSNVCRGPYRQNMTKKKASNEVSACNGCCYELLQLCDVCKGGLGGWATLQSISI